VGLAIRALSDRFARAEVRGAVARLAWPQIIVRLAAAEIAVLDGSGRGKH
jgi:hypothetical protein